MSDDAAFCGYGIEVQGLRWPKLPRLAARHRATLRWSAHHDAIPSRHAVWTKETETSIVVGWSKYAEYTVDAAPPCLVEARLGPIDELEAGLAFVISVLPLSLPLFGLEPFHASTVLTDDGALVLLGAAGSGKSSIAAELVRRGYKMMADDACALDEEGMVWPGPPLAGARLKNMPGDEVGTYADKSIVAVRDYFSGLAPVARVLSLAPRGKASPRVRRLDPEEAVVAALSFARAPWALRHHRRLLQLHTAAMLAALGIDELAYQPPRSAQEVGRIVDAITMKP